MALFPQCVSFCNRPKKAGFESRPIGWERLLFSSPKEGTEFFSHCEPVRLGYVFDRDYYYSDSRDLWRFLSSMREVYYCGGGNREGKSSRVLFPLLLRRVCALGCELLSIIIALYA